MNSVLPTGTRRYTRSQTRFGTRPVELVTSDPRGDLIEGHMRVPLRLVGTKPHTNERLEFEQYIASQVKRWVEWREHLGWRCNSIPQVKGPVDPPVSRTGDEEPDWKEFHVRAHFKPTRVILAGFEDIYEQERKAAMYGIDLWAPKPVSSLEGQRTRKTIIDHRPFLNPLHDAETRRQQYGLKRTDLLYGPLSEPLRNPREPK